ncbi:MAG: glycosyltransferase family 2 protein [Nanoarchaeota archaeon]|nr:glycosyltransferase family 2 protein [Nanoarchaeota archaeon]
MQVNVFTGNIIMDLSMFLFFGVFVFIMLILITSILTKKRTYDSFHPPVTVLVPAYNERKHLDSCLKAIIANKYQEMELIIIDDGSTDSTPRIIEKFTTRYPFISSIKGDHQGKSAALNKGLQKAKHDIIISIDADTMIEKDFLSEIVKPFSDARVGATNGMCFAQKPRKVIEWFQSVEYLYNNFIRSSFSSVFDNGIWFFGAAAAYKKSVVENIGGFSKDTMTEDMDISLSIFNAGYKVLTVKDAAYYTKAPHSVKDLFIQRMRWFYGGMQNIIKHRKVFSRKSFAIKFLFSNQMFWSLYSLLIIPLVAYQVKYWLPSGTKEIFWYLFRWFSLSGPIVVLQKIPEWGLNFVNIFGVLAGILTTVLIFASFRRFRKVPNFKDLIIIFFYFPYTLVLNATFLVAAIKFPFSKKKGFIK